MSSGATANGVPAAAAKRCPATAWMSRVASSPCRLRRHLHPLGRVVDVGRFDRDVHAHRLLRRNRCFNELPAPPSSEAPPRYRLPGRFFGHQKHKNKKITPLTSAFLPRKRGWRGTNPLKTAHFFCHPPLCEGAAFSGHLSEACAIRLNNVSPVPLCKDCPALSP